MQLKRCSPCKVLQSTSCFSKSKNEKYGVGHECKSCTSSRFKKHRKNNLEKMIESERKYRKENKEYVLQKSREYHYKNNYGVSYQEILSLWEATGRCCEICGRETTFGGKLKNSAHIDHDHKNNKIRGVLCSKCNKALGLIEDNPITAIGMAIYLKNHTQEL